MFGRTDAVDGNGLRVQLALLKKPRARFCNERTINDGLREDATIGTRTKGSVS